MKHSFIIGAVIILLAGIALVIMRGGDERTPEPVACTMDARICPDGSSVGRTGPNCEFAPCPTPTVPADIQAEIDAKRDLIVLTEPQPLSVIASPVTLRGTARGYWFFEASFPVIVVDWDGRIIGEGVATADGEWMTEEFVPFTASINFTVDPNTPYRRGAIILKKDNPSGLPENDNALEIPVLFK